MGDARFDRSTAAIREALLRLLVAKRLDGISMAEVARMAGVSRSTLYSHYGNVLDIYRSLVVEFLAGLQPLGAHLRCGECFEAGGRPFCVALRSAGPYAPVVRDARFMSTLFSVAEEKGLVNDMLDTYAKLGTSPLQAEALFRFQMSGCYAVAMSDVPNGEWEVVQRTLDAFIRGGINAVRVPLG